MITSEIDVSEVAEETIAGLSLSEFPSSCFELRPQEACLYAVYNEGTALESEVYKLVLSDDQVDGVAETYSLPNSLEQLIAIVPQVREYLDEGITTFKILSAVESDSSRSSYVVCSAMLPSSTTSSSNSSSESVLSFDL